MFMFALAPVWLSAQTIYLINSDGLWRLNLETCDKELIVEVELSNVSDIAFHPDGTLYGIDPGGALFTIDTLTGDTNFVYKFSGQLFQAMTCSKAGILYITGRDGELWTYDPMTGIALFLGNIGYLFAGDLTFFGGELYMTSVNDDLIILIDLDNLSNSKIVMTDAGGLGGGMYGIVTDARDCNNVRFYGFVSGNFLVSELDIGASTSDTICILDRLMAGATTSHEFKASDPIRVIDTVIVHPDCGLSNGIITVTTIGGTPPYQYTLNGNLFQKGNTFGNLSAGEYSIDVVDSRNCLTTIAISLVPQDISFIDSFQITDETCEAHNGEIQVFTSENDSLLYSIDGLNFQLSNLFSNLDQGFYEITVMNVAGCTDVGNVDIQTITPVSITDIQITPTSCGLSNGIIDIETMNGFNIIFSINDTAFQNENVFEHLAAGVYAISVMDENGCVNDSMAEIPSSAPPLLDSITIIQPACEESNGSVIFYLQKSSGNETYALNSGVGQTSSSFLQLGDGHYTWTVTDTAGCLLEGDFQLMMTGTIDNPEIKTQSSDCGQDNGVIELIWNDSLPEIDILLNDVAVESSLIIGLSPGEYNLTLTNELGCIQELMASISRIPCDIYIPDIFSPNGDGINDVFLVSAPSGSTTLVKEFAIFDRWGNMVFSVNDLSLESQPVSWDGTSKAKKVNSGVVTYYMILVLEGGVQQIHSGDISLIR